MDIDRKQRTDIDTVTNDRLTLAIDESNIEDNPYVHETIKGMEGNNWVNEGAEYVKYNLVEDDNLILIYDPITKLSQKSINKVTVSFDYVLSNNINRPILDNISLVADSTYHEIVNYELNNSGHVDIDCEIFGIDEVVLNTIISIQGFGIGLNFNGKYSNATIRISNVRVSFKYSDKLYDESGSVINRLEPYIDFYRDDDGDLILQIGGDATGKGMDRGGTIDTYSKTEIDNKLATKVDTQIGKGLSSNDYTNAEKDKLSGIAENANYYIHPSTHGTGIIVEQSALPNLETSENATQHEINLAIDSKINSGGGSVDWSDIQNKPSDYPPSTHNHDSRYYTESEIDTALSNKVDVNSLSTVATTGDYDDLIDKPIIPSKTSDLTNDSGFITSSSLPTKTSDLQNDGDGTNAFLTQHQSLSNYIQKSNTNGLLKNDGSVDTTSYSTFSGSYNDLSNKPTIPAKISDLTNDSDFIEKSNTSGLVKNDGSIDTTSYLSSLPSHTHDDRYYTETEVDTALSGKQATLVSGTNIKTINNTSLLGSGNISIQGGGSVTVDSALSTTSENPVQNKVITGALNGKADSSSLSTVATSGSYIDLSNKPSIPSSSSDLSDGSDLVKKSNTSGLLKNDGSVDTSSYITSSALNGYQTTSNLVTSFSSTTSDSKYPSEKLTKTELDKKIAKSSTSGLVKNDGSIDTSTYLTSSSLSNYVQKSQTTGLLKNDGTVDTTSYSTFSGSYNDLSNKPSIPSKTSDLTNDGADGTNVFVANNDSRLSDSRTPLAHTHLSSDVTDLIDVIYPVGSIYMSVSNTSPQTLFGGTWQQLRNTFLYASTTADTNSTTATGGSADSVVVSHKHNPQGYTYFLATSGDVVSKNSNAGQTGTKVNNLLQQSSGSIARTTTDTQGESGTGKNMPPYMKVYMWKRTA